jgi:opacity protein-like surface antigen
MNKNLFILATVVCFFISVNAQAQFKIGARAGLNLTNISMKFDGTKPSGDEKSKMKPGFQVGVVGEFGLGKSFALQPALLVATQGCKFKVEDYKSSTNLTYIQVPINAMYKLGVGNLNILFQAGPYLGYAIAGKYKWEEDGKKESEKIEFGSDEEKHDMKAFDFGLGLGAGVELMKSLQIGLGYNIGLANLSNAEKTKAHNNGLALTVTYLFGKK